MEALYTEQLTKNYGNKTVVDAIDLSVHQGIIFGFLGKNGAGKSTFINMITGLIHSSSGSFKVLGHDAKDLTAIQKEMGVLPDYSTFYEDLTAYDHLNYFQKLLKESLSKNQMLDVLTQVGLREDAFLKVKHYSFGMKKKLGIAQSIIQQPKILFLDEPTSGVDANSILNIHTLIKNIASKGTTVFLTSHNLDEVEKLCDEIAIMDKGSIKIQGTMKELQAQYRNDITLNISHQPLSEKVQVQLSKGIKDFSKKGNIGETRSIITVQSKYYIPKINQYFVHHDIDVFQLEVQEASLEEIFLNLE